MPGCVSGSLVAEMTKLNAAAVTCIVGLYAGNSTDYEVNISDSFLVLCREALLRVAGGPELFLSMRGTYSASLAAVSMAGYVAGVGDRHTDNFLVDLNSGALVPIDFGQAPSHLCLSHTCVV